jgi:hypothetical protein
MKGIARHTGRSAAIAGATALATVLATGIAAAGTLEPDPTELVTVTSATETTNEDIGNTAGWIEQSYDCTDETGPWLAPDQSFVDGPEKPVLGDGSHVMETTQFAGDTQLFRTGQYDGTYVSDIVHLAYSTYTTAVGSDDVKQPASLRLSFNTDGDEAGTTDLTLWYEPSISHPTEANTQDEWMSWQPTEPDEIWSIGGGQAEEDLITWAAFQETYGDATLSNTENGGGVTFIVGCSGGTQTSGKYYVDGFGVETTADHADATEPSVAQYVDFEDGGNGLNDLGIVNVDANSPHGWDEGAYNDAIYLNPNQSMVFGPGNPPLGFGSHKFRLTDAEDNVVEVYRTDELDGTLVGDIRELDYSTYVQPDAGNTNAQQPPYLRLSIDTDNDGFGDDTLYYEPAINHGEAIQSDVWQEWNTAEELWSRSGAGDSDADLTTLAGYASHHPQATLAAAEETTGPGGLSIIVGASGESQDDANFYVDAVHVRYFTNGAQETEKTYDFEPIVPSPTISAPRRVTGITTVTIQGNAVPNSDVKLYEKRWNSTTKMVATTTADGDGHYEFHRRIGKQTSWRVQNYDKFSAIVTTKVRIALDLRTSSPREGRLKMVGVTEPNAAGETIRFYHLKKNGERDLLAKCTVKDTGKCGRVVDAPSGKTWTLLAKVTAPSGNLAGKSTRERQTIK